MVNVCYNMNRTVTLKLLNYRDKVLKCGLEHGTSPWSSRCGTGSNSSWSTTRWQGRSHVFVSLVKVVKAFFYLINTSFVTLKRPWLLFKCYNWATVRLARNPARRALFKKTTVEDRKWETSNQASVCPSLRRLTVQVGVLRTHASVCCTNMAFSANT